jgi:small subunit ribosomal protein S17
MVGTVVSVKMDKTAVVSIERRRPHPLYRKIVRTTKRYKAHDPRNEAVLGDVVRIEETRPISKDKHWRISETLVRGNVADVQPREIGVPEEAILVPTPPPAPVSQPEEEPASQPDAAPVSQPEAETEASPAAQVAEGDAEPSGPDIAAEATAAEAEETAEAVETADADERKDA